MRFLGLPIRLQGNVVGMIGLANKLNDYEQSDATFLQPLLDALGALFIADDESASSDLEQAVLDHADKALYEAKKSGRNRVVWGV